MTARTVASLTRADEGQKQKKYGTPLASLTSSPDRGSSAGDFCLLFRIIVSRDDRQFGEVIDLGRAELDLCQKSGDVSGLLRLLWGYLCRPKTERPPVRRGCGQWDTRNWPRSVNHDTNLLVKNSNPPIPMAKGIKATDCTRIHPPYLTRFGFN